MMVSITVKATITITITIPNQMKCQSRFAINLIPANPVSQKGICSKIDMHIAILGLENLSATFLLLRFYFIAILKLHKISLHLFRIVTSVMPAISEISTCERLEPSNVAAM